MTNDNDIESGDGYSEALLQSTIERLKARDDARRFVCMTLPTPVFKELCARLLDRKTPVRHTAFWLASQVPEAPTRSSVERFADTLFDEYRLVELDQQTGEAQRYTEAMAQGDPEALQMTLNHRMTQLMTGELLRTNAGESIDTKRLIALSVGLRVVSKNAFDKRSTDVRIRALEAQIRQRDTAILMVQQRLQKVPERLDAVEAALAQVEKSRAAGKTVDPTIYAAIRAELTRVRETVCESHTQIQATQAPGGLPEGRVSEPYPEPTAS